MAAMADGFQLTWLGSTPVLKLQLARITVWPHGQGFADVLGYISALQALAVP